MKVGIHKGRAEQLALRVDGFLRLNLDQVGWQSGRHVGNAAILHGHRHAGAAIGQGGVVN